MFIEYMQQKAIYLCRLSKIHLFASLSQKALKLQMITVNVSIFGGAFFFLASIAN